MKAPLFTVEVQDEKGTVRYSVRFNDRRAAEEFAAFRRKRGFRAVVTGRSADFVAGHFARVQP